MSLCSKCHLQISKCFEDYRWWLIALNLTGDFCFSVCPLGIQFIPFHFSVNRDHFSFKKKRELSYNSFNFCFPRNTAQIIAICNYLAGLSSELVKSKGFL